LASTSPDELARELLECSLAGAPVPNATLDRLLDQAADPDRAVAAPASQSLFRGLVEPLADRFEPLLCDAYVGLFSRAIEFLRPELDAGELARRYQRIRRAPHYTDLPRRPARVFVLSRVTLGADVAITSVILDAAKKRFPDAEIYFVGARKGWELFARDTRIRHLPISYGRSDTLAQRLNASRQLEQALSGEEHLVIDPDSRLTQLGLLPVCPESRYFFFESRAYGGENEDSLATLTKRWVAETLGVVDAVAYVAPAESDSPEAGITLSLGVGENPDKGLPESLEAGLLSALASLGLPVLVDKGSGGQEAERVERARASLREHSDRVDTWTGAFAPFASSIARSRLYVGYDSAGQHVAAACGVPRLTLFAGYSCERMLQRWQPTGRGRSIVIRASEAPPDAVLQSAVAGVRQLLGME